MRGRNCEQTRDICYDRTDDKHPVSNDTCMHLFNKVCILAGPLRLMVRQGASIRYRNGLFQKRQAKVMNAGTSFRCETTLRHTWNTRTHLLTQYLITQQPVAVKNYTSIEVILVLFSRCPASKRHPCSLLR